MTSFLYMFFFKQKTAYEMRISDWSSDVCSSDLYQFPEKYYLIPYFPDGYIVILYPWHASCHFIQLMIMSRKQGSGPRRGMIVNVFSNGPGNGKDRKSVV